METVSTEKKRKDGRQIHDPPVHCGTKGSLIRGLTLIWILEAHSCPPTRRGQTIVWTLPLVPANIESNPNRPAFLESYGDQSDTSLPFIFRWLTSWRSEFNLSRPLIQPKSFNFVWPLYGWHNTRVSWRGVDRSPTKILLQGKKKKKKKKKKEKERKRKETKERRKRKK